MNIDNEKLKQLTNLVGKEFAENILKEGFEKEKQLNEKYEKEFDFEINDKPCKIKLKTKITPEVRHELRKISTTYPKYGMLNAIQEVNNLYPDLRDNEMELRNKIVELFPPYTLDDIREYLMLGENYIDTHFEKQLDIFYLSYFQVIISMDGNTAILKNTKIIEGDKINDLWNNVDMVTVKEAVQFFRKKASLR